MNCLKLGLVFVGASVLSGVAGCSGAAGTESSGTTSSAVTVCAGSSTVKGVDVSDYQGSINWTAAAASGLSFAIARVSDGTGYPDTTFATNYAGIKKAGMIRGAYQFFRASESPTAQANLMISAVGTLGAGDLAPIADVEVLDGESGATLVANLAIWVAKVQAATGRTPIIYTDPGFWDALPDTSQFANNVLWVANWGVSCPTMPPPWSTWSLWQYSDTGSAAGMSGEVDLDTFNGSLADLQALASGAAPAPTTPVTPTSTSCYSSTLATTVAENTCVETDDSGDWVQCDAGSWVNRYDDPTACGAVYPWSNGGHSAGGGATCYSSTLGAEEPDNACVQSRSDNKWYQCDNGTWTDRWTDPTACNGVYPL